MMWDKTKVQHDRMKPLPLITIGIAALVGVVATYCYRVSEAPERSQAVLPHRALVSAVAPNGPSQLSDKSIRGGTAGGPSNDVRVQFANSADLEQFVGQLTGRANAGDATADRWIASAYEECNQFGIDPGAYATMLKNTLHDHLSRQQVQSFDTAIANEIRRCQSLRSEPGANQKSSYWYAAAEKNGDRVAQIRQLENSTDIASVDESIRDAGNDRDGDAMLAVGDLLSHLSEGDRQALSGISSDRVGSVAWKLAACDVGADCTPAGAQMRNICIRAALCDFPSLPDALRAMYSPIDFQRALQLRDRLLSQQR